MRKSSLFASGIHFINYKLKIQKVLVNGLFNYLFVCAIFAVATIPIGCLLGNRNQEKKEIEVDRMEEFLAENVFKTDQMAKV